jgi:glycopeptide antibiotics resistance protein
MIVLLTMFWFLLFTKINETIGTNRTVTSKLLKNGFYKMSNNVQNMKCAFNVFEKSAPTTQLK